MRSQTKLPCGRRAVVAGGGEGRAHALALGDRRLDVEARLAQRGRRDRARRAPRRRRRRAPLEQRGRLRVRDARSRPAARRSRTPSRACAATIRFGSSATSGTHVTPPNSTVRLVDDDGRLRVRARERGDLRRARAARRSGCSGCRPRSGRRPSGSADDLGARELRSRSGRARRSAGRSPRGGRGRGRSRAQSRISSSAPAPTTICSGSSAAVRRRRLAQLAVGAVRVLVQPREALARAGPAAPREAAACSGRTGAPAPGAGRAAPRPRRRTAPRRTGAERPRRRARSRALHRGSSAGRRGSGRPFDPRERQRDLRARASSPSASRARSGRGFRKLSSPSPPAARARPPVGRTCVAPAA